MPRPHWRKMTWVIVIWCVVIVAWMIGGGSAAQDANDCASEATKALQQVCQDATDVGTGLGIAVIAFIGFVGFVFLSIIWFMTRPRGRDCPACGEKVKKGRSTCPNCNFDLAAAARGEGQPTSTTPA